MVHRKIYIRKYIRRREGQLITIFLFRMADKAPGAAVKEALSTKTVLELLEEDDEFEVSYCEESFC